MKRTLTALFAASAMLIAACGDDSDDTETDEAADADPAAQELCDSFYDPTPGEELADIDPPDEIADAWTSLAEEPDDMDMDESVGSDALAEVIEYLEDNCEVPDMGGGDPEIEQFCSDVLVASDEEAAEMDPPDEIAEAWADYLADDSDEAAEEEILSYVTANCEQTAATLDETAIEDE